MACENVQNGVRNPQTYLLLPFIATVIGLSTSKQLNISSITITNAIDVKDSLSTPIRLEINDEINIEIRQNDEEPIKKESLSRGCCLQIDPPQCSGNQCVVRRRKRCSETCANDVMIGEAPGFLRGQFPKEFIPEKWQTEQFPENLTITLTGTEKNRINSQYSPYPYFAYYNALVNPYQGYFQSRPQGYWCPGPYCPLYWMYR